MIAYQSSKESVSDFIQRYINDHPNNDWDQLKAELSARFAEITDAQHAFMLLRKVKQKSNENVQLFAERLLALSEEAVAGQQGGVQSVKTQLIGFFIDGLIYDYLKMKVMRDNPQTLAAAVNSAVTEQNLRKRSELRRGQRSDTPDHEPMEIDHSIPAVRCYKCNKIGHVAKRCRTKKIESVLHNNRQFDSKAIICWKCGKRGHFKRDCKEERETEHMQQEN